MSKNVQLFPSKKNPRILSEDRINLYTQLINNRPITPMAVLEGNLFTLCRQNSITQWQVPWFFPNGNRLILKLEHLSDYNPTGSMYDRLYPYLFRQWESGGFIVPGKGNTPVIECSAGNAGAAFCHTAVKLGYRNHNILIPKDIYPSRIEQVGFFGGNVHLSPANQGELGYMGMIESILQDDAKGKGRIGRDLTRMIPVTNTIRVPNAPYAKLVSEVQDALMSMGLPQKIDTFLFGIGAGNTISQVSLALRSMQKGPLDVQVVEFKECPYVAAIRAGKKPPANGGWPSSDMAGTIFGVPIEKLNLRLEVIDGVLPLTSQEREEGRALANGAIGLCAGRPTGMVIMGALKQARKVHNKQILSIVFDSIAKYEDYYDAVMDVDFECGKPIRMSERENVRLAVS